MALGPLYTERAKAAFEEAAQCARLVEGIRWVLRSYLQRQGTAGSAASGADGQPLPTEWGAEGGVPALGPVQLLPAVRSYRSAEFHSGQCLSLLSLLCCCAGAPTGPGAAAPRAPAAVVQALVEAGAVAELFACNLKRGTASGRAQALQLLVGMARMGDGSAGLQIADLIRDRVLYCIKQHRALDVAAAVKDELALLSELATSDWLLHSGQEAAAAAAGDARDSGADTWQHHLLLLFQLLLHATGTAPSNPAVVEHVVLPCLHMLLDLCADGHPGQAPGRAMSSGGSVADSNAASLQLSVDADEARQAVAAPPPCTRDPLQHSTTAARCCMVLHGAACAPSVA